MTEIFYTLYDPAGLSIPQITQLEHQLGRELLSYGLLTLYGLSMKGEALEEEIAYGPNGKPCLRNHPSIHFNISHCEGLAVCGFSGAELGLDAELPGYFAPILIKRALAPSEKEHLLRVPKEDTEETFFRYWTLKEAYVKQTGTGADVCLTDFFFAFSDTGIVCSTPGLTCHQEKLPTGHILSVIVKGDADPVRLCPVQL